MKKSVAIGIMVMPGVGATIAPTPLWAQEFVRPLNQGQNVLFRTQSYVAQIIWRAGVPFLSVSNNGWRVLANVRARVLPARGTVDEWTTYFAQSGDYRVYVRVHALGQAAIAVRLAGGEIREEYATLPLPKRQPVVKPMPQADTVLAFETDHYAVRVFRQQGKLLMNVHNTQSKVTELKQAAVTLVNTSDGVIYQHEGNSTIQAREDIKGRRSLLIIRDNAIQYRGEAIF